MELIWPQLPQRSKPDSGGETMASFESIQRRIDNRYDLAQRNINDIAQNNQGSHQDMLSFLNASRQMAAASFSITEQSKFKHSLTKAIIDAVQ